MNLSTNLKYLTLLFIILLGMFTSACHNQEAITELPGQLIEREQLKQVLTDIHQAESLAADLLLKKDTTYQLLTKDQYYQEVFKKHQISAEDFRKSYDHYARNTKKFQQLYEELIKDMKLQEKKLQKKAKEANKKVETKVDSVKKDKIKKK